MEVRLDRLERFIVGALVYLGLSSIWIYGALDSGVLEDRAALYWSALAIVVLAHIAFGFVIREWVALLLPIVLPFLAIPAGVPESDYEPPPVWMSQVLLVVVEVPLIAAGLGLRALVDGRRASIRSS